MTVEARSDLLHGLIDPAAELTCLGGGYQFTEGPVWSPREQCLYFSDIPGDTLWRWTEAGGMEPVLQPSRKSNGLTLDADGNLLVCEHVTSTVSRFRADRSREVLASHCGGTALNSPNDIVVRSNGDVYFSDPDYGRWNDWIGSKREPELGFKTVLRVPGHGGGEAEPVAARDEFDQANGLCFSPDESLLYVNDSPRAHIKVFDVAADGSLANGRILLDRIGAGFRAEDDGLDEQERHQELHDSGAVDGMKCDELGNVWVTGPGGVWVISPDGEHLGVIRAPEVVGNLTWGGADLRSLFLMTSTTVHVVRTLTGPAPLPHH
jgi:gluconolactonase